MMKWIYVFLLILCVIPATHAFGSWTYPASDATSTWRADPNVPGTFLNLTEYQEIDIASVNYFPPLIYENHLFAPIADGVGAWDDLGELIDSDTPADSGTQSYQGWIGDYDNDGTDEYVRATLNYIHAFGIDTSDDTIDISLEQTSALTADAIHSPMTCSEDTNQCIFLYESSGDNYIGVIDGIAKTLVSYEQAYDTDLSFDYAKHNNVPVLIYNSVDDSITAQFMSNSGIHAMRINSSGVFNDTNYFGGDGIFTHDAGYTRPIGFTSLYDITGDYGVAYTISQTSDLNNQIEILNSVGSVYYTFDSAGDDNPYYASNPYYCKTTNADDYNICWMFSSSDYGGTNPYSREFAYNIDSNSDSLSFLWENYIGAGETNVPFHCMAYRNNAIDINTSTYCVGYAFGNTSTIYKYSNEEQSMATAADITGDLLIDLVYTTNTGYTILRSSNESINTLDWLRVPYNYYSDQCVANVTFKAVECLDGTDSCNYINLVNENERIYSDCGSAADATGSYSPATPEVTCNLDEAKTYTINFYLQSESNPTNTDDIAQLTLTTSTEDCGTDLITLDESVNVTETAVADGADDTTDNQGGLNSGEIDIILDTFLGGSTLLKLIIGIAIIISLTVYVATHTDNFVAIIATLGMSLILTTFLGLIPIYILISGMVVGALGMVYMFTVGRGTVGRS